MSVFAPFQLLEINMISAQALEPVCRRKMKTYAVAWVHSERKLSTRIDNQGHTNPTWNDKFVFRVHEEFLHRDTSAVTIEIYAVHWFRNIHVGTVRATVGNLIPLVSQRQNRLEVQLGMQFVALQVWRPSGRPQGILNIGVALLDSSMRSMPLYLQMGTSKSNKYQLLVNGLLKPDLRRTKSDSSSILESDLRPPGKSTKRSSIVDGGSMINSRGSSMVNYVFEKTSKKGKPNSAAPPGKSPTGMRFTGLGCGAPRKLGGSTIWTDSELGPSPSEVAAAVAKNLQHNRMEEAESSLADGEIPTTSTTKHTRNGGRYPRDDGVSFSCFGNICGCAISITCGPGSSGSRKKRL
ncbi:hypothetical protein ES332_D10G194100v1 [Gossypium tomentosum]|uniref:C2 domain-containing protein n=1 Tax=Gossypium tomentosum TaxID=34277 RepID=A0A5D2J769_GOSTO|nr:hypothetical protein ES332_D10G194100v1 [Gossypium tomentosum]